MIGGKLDSAFHLVPYPLLQTASQQTEKRPLLFQRDPLEQVTCRLGDTSCASAHASTLNRSTAVRPLRAKHSLLQLQRQYGNRYVQRVLAMTKGEDDERQATPTVERAIQGARGGRHALDSGVRAQMEPAFGADFSGVRVHADGDADALSRSLNARAFTTGQDIFFRQGAYSPGSSSGRELLAHELTHVVQQAGEAHPKLTVNQPGDKYEREADRVAEQVLQQEQQPIQKESDEGLMQRQMEEEEPIQAKMQDAQVRRQAEGEKEEEEEEPIQAKAEGFVVQRREEQGEEEEPIQARAENAEVCWQIEEEYESNKDLPSSSSTLLGLTTEWRAGSPPVEKSVPVSSLHPPIRHDIEARSGQGSEVPQPLRRTAESQLGTDLSAVRIHTGSEADELAQDLQAQAFTTGTDVYLSSAAAKRPEVVGHELQHAASKDRTALYFWCRARGRDVRPPEPRTLADVIRQLQDVLQSEPPPDLDGLQNALRPLLRRTDPDGSTCGQSNLDQIGEFFDSYPQERFIEELAHCVARMIDANPQCFESEVGPHHETPRDAARVYYLRHVMQRVNLVRQGILGQAERCAELLILSISGRTRARTRERIEREERQRAARQSDWVSHWQEQYGGIYNANYESRLILWLLDHWPAFMDPAQRVGRTARALGWGPTVDPSNYASSFAVLDREMISVEAYGNARDAGLAFFQSVHNHYRQSVRLLGSHAEFLQNELFRPGAVYGAEATSAAIEQNWMRQNLVYWRWVNAALGPDNQERRRRIHLAWDLRWGSGRMVGRVIPGLFFDIGEDGSPNLSSLTNGILRNIGIDYDANDNRFRLQSPTVVAVGGWRYLEDWND